MTKEKVKAVQPKTGKNHRIFGSRFLKLHKMRDPKWTPNDKFTQYIGLTLLHGKLNTFFHLTIDKPYKCCCI